MREPFETGDTFHSVPGSQTKRRKVVDPIRYTEPVHQRCQPDAAGHNENRRIPAQALKHATQPTQEPLYPIGAIVFTQHTLEENRQFIDYHKRSP